MLRIIHHTALVGLLLLLLALTAQGQDTSGRAGARAEPGQPVVVDGADVQTTFITPRAADVHEVFQLARELYGRWLHLSERGGVGGAPVFNLQRLGGSLLVYDVPEQALFIKERLLELDAQAALASAGERSQPAIQTVEWSPRHVSVDTAWRAIAGMQRTVMTNDAHGAHTQSPNITRAEGANMIVLRETTERMGTLKSLLERVDQPEEQLLITCMVIAATDGTPDGPALPTELTDDLAQLVPFDKFSMLSLGVMRSSVRSEQIELNMDNAWQLEIEPEAFDSALGRLTAKVAFKGVGQSFRTRTTIGLGEYTVLGATGREPVFAVIQARALKSNSSR
jgi:hypothetical protein